MEAFLGALRSSPVEDDEPEVAEVATLTLTLALR
tara:strand:- start:576 stop:677 length:102 start_codon:yes stop_codon:yes gene_type:complete